MLNILGPGDPNAGVETPGAVNRFYVKYLNLITIACSKKYRKQIYNNEQMFPQFKESPKHVSPEGC